MPTEHVLQPKTPIESVGDDNVLIVESFKTLDMSASPYRYTDGGQPFAKVPLLKIIDGKAAKLKTEKAGAKNRKVTFKYKTE